MLVNFLTSLHSSLDVKNMNVSPRDRDTGYPLHPSHGMQRLPEDIQNVGRRRPFKE